MIPLADARTTALGVCPPPVAVTVPLAEAVGCVLAEPATAAVAVPPFANSAMDGYALRAADAKEAPVTLEVTGRVLAGADAAAHPVGPGQAVRIMTGAPVPEGADAVCMVERTREDGPSAVVIEGSVAPGENVRPAGDDVAVGDVVLDAGAAVGATQLAALISAGCDPVRVYRRPRVGVLSTGDELVDLGSALGPAQIYDSNRPMLMALVAEAGCPAVDLGRSPDDERTLTRRIEAALGEVDVLVLSGGVSVGDVDLVKVVLDRLGGGKGAWMQIAIRPAKPFSCAALSGPSGPVPAFGLPGNPVSSAVSFELLVRPALLAMAGRTVTERPRMRATAAEPLRRRPDGKLHFVRVRLEHRSDGGWSARPSRGQASHQIASLAVSHGLALVEDGEGLPEGAEVEVMVTDESVLGTAVAR